MTPKWRSCITLAKRELIQRAFQNPKVPVASVAGSCVLAGVYLGHRSPIDVDLLFRSRQDAKESCTVIAGWLNGGHSGPCLEHAHTFRAQGEFKGEPIDVHCANRPFRWSADEFQKRYLLTPGEMGGISVPTVEYMAFEKLIGLQTHDSQSRRAIRLFDLMALAEAGITPEVIATEIRWMCNLSTPGNNLRLSFIAYRHL